MRKSCVLTSLVVAFSLVINVLPLRSFADGVEINSSNFPDPVFRSYIQDTFSVDDNYLSDEEISAVTEIHVGYSGIYSLDGIEVFYNLQKLFCGGNHISSLDVSHNTSLLCLQCEGNNIRSLDLHNNTKLNVVYCYDNKLNSLNISNCTELYGLNCVNNSLLTIDLSTNMLLARAVEYGDYTHSLNDPLRNYDQSYMFCDATVNIIMPDVITPLNEASSVEITEDNFPDEQFRAYILTNIDNNHDNFINSYEFPAFLTISRLSINSLEGIQYFSTLRGLYCSENNLYDIDLSQNVNLEELDCSSNHISTLDLINNSKLEVLDCSDNVISSLNISSCTNLFYLDCSGMYDDMNYPCLLHLDISNNPNLCYALDNYTDISEGAIITIDYSPIENPQYCHQPAYGYFSRDYQTELNTCVHSIVTDESVNPTCSLTGLTEGSHCSVCGEVIVPQEIIPALGHTIVIDPAVNPTFTETGLTEGSHCSVCGEVIVPQEIVPVLTEDAICINEVNFPDDIFRDYVLNNIDANGDAYLVYEEVNQVTKLDIRNMGISDLSGIEFFQSLQVLYCQGNQIEYINLCDCSCLSYLKCTSNPLISISISDCPNLQTIDCQSNNDLREVSVTGLDSLLAIYMNNCVSAESLSITDCENLRVLDLRYTAIESVDLSGCISLETLECDNSSITSIDVTNCCSLMTMQLNNCAKLESINASGLQGLSSISCCRCPLLTNLNISGCTYLTSLDCYLVNLDTIDISDCQYLLETYNDGTYTHTNDYNSYRLSYYRLGYNDGIVIITQKILNPEVIGHSLLLSDEIGVRFRVSFPDNFDSSNCYCEFLSSDGRSSTMIYDDSISINGSNDRYFVFNINALELADEITAVLYYGDGQMITDDYSAMEYITFVQDNPGRFSNSERIVALVNALQDYGYYLQHSGWTDNLMHTPISEPSRYLGNEDISDALIGVNSYSLITDLGDSGLTDTVRVALTLNSRTQLRISVRPEEGVSITSSGYTIRTIDNVEYYQFSISNIGPKNLDKEYTLIVETDRGTGSVCVSALYYINAIMNSGILNNDQMLSMTAYYNYYYAAENY